MHRDEKKMVIPERKNQIAYYYRTTHRDYGYDQYMEEGRKQMLNDVTVFNIREYLSDNDY